MVSDETTATSSNRRPACHPPSRVRGVHRRGRLRCGTGRQHRAGAGESHAPRSRHCPDRLFGRHGGSRVEFCRRLKARVATSRIPVLGLIGAADRLNARAAVVAGCTVLAKPCSPERLLVEIVRVLGVWPLGPAVAAGSTTVDQLTLMLGRVLRENAQLMERNNSLSDAAQLWAIVRACAQTREPGVGRWPPQRLVAAPDGTGHSRGGCDARATAPRKPRTVLTDRRPPNDGGRPATVGVRRVARPATVRSSSRGRGCAPVRIVAVERRATRSSPRRRDHQIGACAWTRKASY